MAVTLFVNQTGERITGKFAVIAAGKVTLYSDVTLDETGKPHGDGLSQRFDTSEVTVLAHDHSRELEVISY